MNISKQLISVTRTANKFIRSRIKTFSTKSIEKRKIAVSEAEKIVGNPTSLLTSKWLMKIKDKVGILESTKITEEHPALTVARDFLVNSESPSWALLVSLVSKAGGVTKPYSQDDYDLIAGILHNQKEIAEISEMLRKTNTLHKSVDMENVHLKTKIGVLSGDYILGSIFEKCANVGNCDVSWLVFSCLRDLSQQTFFEPTDKHNKPLPARPVRNQKKIVFSEDFDRTVNISEVMGNVKAEWTLRHLLGGATTLGKCCQSAIQLAHDSPILQKSSYLIGRNLELALQVKRDMSEINWENGPFTLINAPLMFHFQEEPDFYEEFMNDVEDDNINYTNIRNTVLGGNGMKKSLELQEEFINNVMEGLNDFPDTSAKYSLVNLLHFF